MRHRVSLYINDLAQSVEVVIARNGCRHNIWWVGLFYSATRGNLRAGRGVGRILPGVGATRCNFSAIPAGSRGCSGGQRVVEYFPEPAKKVHLVAPGRTAD